MSEATESQSEQEPAAEGGEGSAIEPTESAPTSSDRTRQIIRSCWTTVALGLFGFLVVYPVVEQIIDHYTPQPQGAEVEDMTLSESIQLRAVQVFAAFWAFAFGSCIGSFVNVLVYRLPRGEGVLMRPSACPACGQKLEARDNLPVLGWVFLGGRCRACQSPISARYPIVEAVFGTMLAALVFIQLTSGGANLPVRRPNNYTGFVWTIFYPKWDLIAMTIYHFHLFTMLWTWGLMKLDGVRIPIRSVIPAFVIAFAAPLLWTKLAVVPPQFMGTEYYPQDLTVTAASLIAGGLAGVVLAVAAALFRVGTWSVVVPSIGLVGVVLGWQAVAVIGLVTIVLTALAQAVARRRLNFVFILFTITFLHHATWRLVYNALFAK